MSERLFVWKSLLLAAVVLTNCITWTASRHHFTHNVAGHRSRHRRQGAGLFLSASYVLPGGEGAGWGEWGEVSSCSRTCGGGVASQKRICLQIGPDGQPQCSGGDTKYFSCQTQDCPAGSKDFREQQCSEFDDVAFRNIKYKWVPYTKAPNPCELNCMPHGDRFYFRQKTMVTDGTRCNDESFDVCVNGTCQPVGCDMMLGSSAREDKCRECRGNGAHCHTTSGTLDTQDIRKGYNDMLLIPEGATTIVIEEIAASSNYLALRAKNGTYYLNGDYHIDFPRSLTIAGALWTYDRSQQGFAAPDKLRCLGPTTEPLYLALLLQDVNVGIAYEYSVPNELAPPRNKRYNWVHEEFTPCSASCGGGFQTRNVSCRTQEELELVDEGLCDREIRPPTNQTCNTDKCAPEWTPGPWGKCSKRCGKGGTMSREVHCSQVITNGYPSIVDDKTCFDVLGPKPELYQVCNENATCPVWFTGPWKPCNKLCDEGKQTRKVVCYQKTGRRIEVLGDEECEDEKPLDEQTCTLQLCKGVDWVVSEWTGCDTCLSTVRTRTVVCATLEHKVVNDSFCANHNKSETQQKCTPSELPSCDVQWYATQWSKCSVECGKGFQKRKVFCGRFDGDSIQKVDDSRCAEQGLTKYNDTKPCDVPAEKCPSQWFAGPWGNCTKKCGGGMQYRHTMCLRGGELADDCDGELFLDSDQPCNTGPCDTVLDSLLPAGAPEPGEDCLYEEDEEYPEQGLDADNSTTIDDTSSTMYSDSPSGMWSSSTADQKSTPFDIESTLTSEEFLSTIAGNGSTTSDFTGLDEDDVTTDTTVTGTETTSDYESTTDISDYASTIDETKSTISGVNGTVTTDTTGVTDSEKTESLETNSTTSSSDDLITVTMVRDSNTTTESGSTTNETETTITDVTKSSDASESSGTGDDYLIKLTSLSDHSTTAESGSTSNETESTITDVTEPSVTDTTGLNVTEETKTTELGSTSNETESTITDVTEPSVTDTTGLNVTEETKTTELGSTSNETESTITDVTEPSVTDTTGLNVTEETKTTELGSTSNVTESTITDVTEASVTDTTGLNVTEETKTTELGSTSNETESTITDVTKPSVIDTTELTEETKTTELGSTSNETESTITDVTKPSVTDTTELTEETKTTELGSTSNETESTITDVTKPSVTDTTEPTEETKTTELGSTSNGTESTITDVTKPSLTDKTETTESDGSTTSSAEDTASTSSESEDVTTESDSYDSDYTSGSTDDTSTIVTEETSESSETEPESSLSTELRSSLSTEDTNNGTTASESTEKTVTPEGSSNTTEGTSETEVTSQTNVTELEPTTKSDDNSTVEVSTKSSLTEQSTKLEGTTESGSSISSNITTESEVTEAGTKEIGSTEATGVSETGSTEVTANHSSETGADNTNVTETTESISTEATNITETGSSQVTETNTTQSTETTESGTTESLETGGNTTDTSESESTKAGETTEAGSTKADETTEAGSTKADETTKAGSSSPETIVTEKTATEVSSSSETTEESSTLSSEGTESSSKISTDEASTTSSARWDFSTVTEDATKKKRVCRPRTCFQSTYGCCPDKKTPALGPFDEGCPNPPTCQDSIYRCCPDGLSPAKGPHNEGCPIEPCIETLFGCCESDNMTAAEGNDQEGCPPPLPACVSSKHGCCKDGETEATGPGKEGCPETTVPETEATETTETTVETEGTDETEMSTTTSPTEPIDQGCAESEFGCCFDNKTAATGPELQGCPCETSEFKCCPDGVTRAQGLDFEGCEKSCNSSDYGCCPDGKTPAHGVDHEGCCLLYPYGCCPDNYRPADGPHFEGCGCQFSRYGCCPDNVTIAAAPEYKGCGCQYTQHGCCPDKHSEASGPEFEGCLCHTYQFACCPDGVTIARGPNGQGCYCQQSKFGCCGDEQTHAKGPNKEGCDCSTSKHGCCLDGTTAATGPKFEGCSDEPENKQAACNLKFERGECRNYSVNWYYDTEYGGCSRFWYGGCDGNNNRFPSKEDCEDTCVSPPPKVACKLPPVKGACLGYYVRWYYDNERETCTNFIYGGCLGNNNNFETRELCQAQCEPERALDQCSLSIERGSCTGNYPRWGYNKERRQCEEFIWGGCGGNSNRFSTEAACMLRCNPPGEPQPECSEPQDVGSCNGTEALWSFSQSENRCVPFYYTGCGGNGNKFQTIEACQKSCPSAFVPELCTLPAASGDCYDYREKWYFDTKDQRCRQFYYGGCGGNGNKFDTERECASRCTPPPATTAGPPTPTTPAPHPDSNRSDFCFMEIDAGPCNQMESKWAYDSRKGKCVAFQYGGCGGNQNNFVSEEHCTYYCKPAQDVCQLPMLSGPCDQTVMSWFYEASSDSCSQFTYGGCEGNENRFATREDCENRCKTGPAPAPTTPATTTTVKTEIRISENLPLECAISPALEQCSQETIGEVWYYDQAANACAAHENLDNGVECRTTGVFYSQEACERSCGVFRNIDVCKYTMDAGPCQMFRPKYHYNSTSRRCEEFAYGGCLGGPNRFSSEPECEQICMSAVDPCTLPPEQGNCIDRVVMWYYDETRDVCYQFAYGGCGGNDNKFENRELCEARCKKQPPLSITTTTPAPALVQTRQPEPEDECRSPVSLEPCGSNMTVFYYDERTSSCRAADTGNCGYRNSYRSEEECERRCGAFRGLDVCQAHLDPGPCRASIPKFYFDAASGSCRQFAYGGCQGGANRFSSSEECEGVCASSGPARACLQEVATGEGCGGAVPERRWHYDVARADCLVFAFQGCGGNENNFNSYEECAYLCRVGPPDAEQNRICDQYAEECNTLETTCSPSNFRLMPAAEGCERCVCEERVNCDQQRRECDALRCSYGIERTTGTDGCEKCKCFEDPCLRINCTSGERCVQSAFRAPITQEVQYSAHCVRDIETNEILNCQTYIDECASISCPYGLQKTRTESGCERCVCAPEEVDCGKQRAECEELKCNYMLERKRGNDGCEKCTCLAHPCSNKVCASGERCVLTPYRDPITGETKDSANCKTVAKPGECPANVHGNVITDSRCHMDCHDDAECRGVLKCCAQGCSQQCVEPAPPATTRAPEIPRAPQASEETEPQVEAAEGGKATLRCIFHGNPPPRITWRFGEITIDSNVDRYRLLSDGALEIVSLYRNDSGVYICVANNELGSAQQEVSLQVNDPVRVPVSIAGEAGAAVTGELDRPLTVRCLAYGHPAPSIYWYRGNGRSMVPFSSALYENRGRELLIRQLTIETLGEYECQAYNGEGRPATWHVVVQAYQPYDDFIPGNSYLVPREQRVVFVTSPQHKTQTTTTTTTPEPKENSYIVPVKTKLLPASTSVSAGAQLSLPCEVDGFPEPQVHWTKDNVVLLPTERMWLTDSRLTIPRALVNDSGEYGCHAANTYSSHSSTVQISVKEIYVPAKCIDNPTFANCKLIVQSNYCRHTYYSKFCCKSCVESGQLDARDAEMQSDEAFRKK